MMERIHVTIGQVRVAKPGQSLHAILGSCIGIGFLFVERRVYGLAHCLLSKSQTKAADLTGRHVDSAILALSELMQLTHPDRRKVHVFLAGGANMTLPEATDPRRLVGSTNAGFAVKAVKEAGFRIQHDDLGGTMGRQVTINCDKGSYRISKIPRFEGRHDAC